jgi:hypothetical protein
MSFYDTILGPAEPVPGLYEALLGIPAAAASPPLHPTVANPARGPAWAAAPAENRARNGDANTEHDAILYRAMRAAGIPPHRLDSAHLVGAANLMAKEGLQPHDAYARVVTRAARDSGLVDDADFRDASGAGGNQHRHMSRRLHHLAQRREAARREETLKLARAFLALAKLTHAQGTTAPPPVEASDQRQGRAPGDETAAPGGQDAGSQTPNPQVPNQEFPPPRSDDDT